MTKISFIKLITVTIPLLILISCNSTPKMECAMVNGKSLLEQAVKQKLIKETALTLADESYTGFTKAMRLNVGYLTWDYKKYLKEQMKFINNSSGEHFAKAIDLTNDVSINIHDIITVSYDKEVNRCSCEAKVNVKFITSDSFTLPILIKYDLVMDSEGSLHAKYIIKDDVFSRDENELKEKTDLFTSLLRSE